MVKAKVAVSRRHKPATATRRPPKKSQVRPPPKLGPPDEILARLSETDNDMFFSPQAEGWAKLAERLISARLDAALHLVRVIFAGAASPLPLCLSWIELRPDPPPADPSHPLHPSCCLSPFFFVQWWFAEARAGPRGSV